jgi:hypothetical protein
MELMDYFPVYLDAMFKTIDINIVNQYWNKIIIKYTKNNLSEAVKALA